MCGIWGSPRFTRDVREMLPFLAVEMLARGSCAWGGTNGSDVTRHLGPIVKSWRGDWDGIQTWHEGIFHTRAASVGASDALENAHPFTSLKADGTSVIGIHNGGISNWAELNATYSRRCAVDSEHLWMHRAVGLSWRELRGYANVAWYETIDGERELRLCRINNTSLHCVRVADGGIVFASTIESIRLAAAMAGSSIEAVFTLVEGMVYRLTDDGIFDTSETTAFGVQTHVSDHYTRVGQHGGGRTFTSYSSNTGPQCKKCGRPPAEVGYLLCKEHMEDMVTQWRIYLLTHPLAVAPTEDVLIAEILDEEDTDDTDEAARASLVTTATGVFSLSATVGQAMSDSGYFG